MAATEPHLTDEIIPAELWPRAHEDASRASAAFSDGVSAAAAVAATYRVSAEHLSATTQGATAEAVIKAHRQLAADHDKHADIRRDIATAASRVATLGHDLATCLNRIEHEAREELAAAPFLPAARQVIISEARARAAAAHTEFTAAVSRHHAQVMEGVTRYLTTVVGQTPVPLSPSPPAPPSPTQPLDTATDPDGLEPRGRGGLERRAKGPQPQGTSDPGRSPLPDGLEQRGPLEPSSPALSPPVPIGSGRAPSAGGGGFGGGGMPTGGLGGMPSSGGLGGLGSGNPLSSLTSGLGQAPGGAAGGGLSSGLPAAAGLSAPTPGVGQPATAFTQGLAAGSAGGGSFVPPPATAAGGGPAVSSAGGVPAAGLSAGQGAPASASGGGMSGAHVAVSAAGGSGGTGAAPPMMLPSPGMGAPAAPVSPGLPATSVTAPAGTVSGSSGGGAPTPTSAGMGGSGAALVPAPVVSAGSVRHARVPNESPELLAAKALASQLRRGSDAALYPVIDWVVGVFRSESGSATETVFMSNEGFGYIPHGVFVPRSARLLTVDPLVDNAFRERWFGWLDPARVLVEYARLRSRGGARLVAAATTSKVVDALREFDVEHASCPRDYNEPLLAPPVLDDMHAHRLAVQWPELFPRITRLADWNDGAVLNRVMVPLVMEMMDGVRHGGGGVDCPSPLRQMWDVLGSGDEIPQKAWEDFALEARLYYTTTSSNPGRDVEADTGGRVVYQAEWLVARTMEVVGGWAHQPPLLTDMAYAAAAACFGDFAATLDPMLRSLEDEAAGEASASR